MDALLRWILLLEHLVREVNVVVVGGIGGGVRTEIKEVVVGEIRIEDHVVEKEEIRIVGEVSGNNRKKSCLRMWDLNLWEGGMLLGVIQEGEEEADLSNVMIAVLVRGVLEEAEETHPRDSDHHSN